MGRIHSRIHGNTATNKTRWTGCLHSDFFMNSGLKVYLAIHIEAEGGAVVAGLWDGATLRTEKIHEFPNTPVAIADTLRWDVLRLWHEIKIGLTLAGRKYGKQVVSIGVDTWGVDFVLLNGAEEILGMPYHYRDARTAGALERAFSRVSRAEIYMQTGIQFMELNSVYQLQSWQKSAPDILDAARTLLFMPDFLHWCLCGSRTTEFTIATTSQCLKSGTHQWALGMLEKLGLPTHFFPEVVAAGTSLGTLRKSVAELTGLTGVKVVTPAAHDTASAVVGVPTIHTGKPDWAYIYSCAWSIMGVEVEKPVLSLKSFSSNFTNEGGVDGTCRLLKNINGMWLVQQCQQSFAAAGREYDLPQLDALAREVQLQESVVDLDDPRFFNPPDVPKAIQDYCQETLQTVPLTDAEVVCCAYKSVAEKYSKNLADLEELTGESIKVIHVVGSGAQSATLNQFTADACQRPVVAGPVEVSVLGNLLIQARADNQFHSLAEMRESIHRISQLHHYDCYGGFETTQFTR